MAHPPDATPCTHYLSPHYSPNLPNEAENAPTASQPKFQKGLVQQVKPTPGLAQCLRVRSTQTFTEPGKLI